MRVNPPPNVSALVGEIAVIAGTGVGIPVTENGRVVVKPPPGCGVFTLTSAEPGFWAREAGTVAVNSFVLAKRVARETVEPDVPGPFHSTVDAGVKLYPVTVIVNCGCP